MEYRNLKIYISGQIGKNGVTEEVRIRFKVAKEFLHSRGFSEVFDPTDERWQKHLKMAYEISYYDSAFTIPANSVDFYTYALLRDQMALSRKDAIYMLSDCKFSPGAQAELAFAKAIGLKVFFEDYWDARRYLMEQALITIDSSSNADSYMTSCGKYIDDHLNEVWLPIK